MWRWTRMEEVVEVEYMDVAMDEDGGGGGGGVER
jgi:hypothetical protein